jgi:hypothetical protein
MRKIRVMAMLFWFVIVTSAHVGAQPGPQIPSDLFFSAASESRPPAPFDTLVRVVSETLGTLPFYTDTTGIRAVSWSPQAHSLSIFRYTSDKIEVCILDRQGQLQTCFEEGISNYAFQDLGENYAITWSTDEQRIYFVVENERILSLVEGDILTGQILRTLYQSPQVYYEWPPLIHWTSTLDYVAVYSVDRPYTSDYENLVATRNVTIIDLKTNAQLELNTYTPELGYFYFCEGFSPLGSYLVARVYVDGHLPGSTANPDLVEIALVDKEGHIVQAINQTQLDQYGIDWAHCPTWQAQEEAFYFVGGPLDRDDPTNVGKTSIFKYTLSTGELTEHKHIGPEAGRGFPAGPLVLSPDGTAIAFLFRDAGIMSEVAVLTPTGEIIRFNEPYSRGTQPRWFPSLE